MDVVFSGARASRTGTLSLLSIVCRTVLLAHSLSDSEKLKIEVDVRSLPEKVQFQESIRLTLVNESLFLRNG